MKKYLEEPRAWLENSSWRFKNEYVTLLRVGAHASTDSEYKYVWCRWEYQIHVRLLENEN